MINSRQPNSGFSATDAFYNVSNPEWSRHSYGIPPVNKYGINRWTLQGWKKRGIFSKKILNFCQRLYSSLFLVSLCVRWSFWPSLEVMISMGCFIFLSDFWEKKEYSCITINTRPDRDIQFNSLAMRRGNMPQIHRSGCSSSFADRSK